MVKVSVIIPVYNAEKYLEECLDSIISQTLKEIEIICIDDGSLDQSYKILLEYSNKNKNITVIRQKNQGPGLARNKGIEQASGKYLCFMDPDDYYVQPEALEKLYLAAETNHALICGGNMIYVEIDEEKGKYRKWFSKLETVVFKDYGDIYGYQRYLFHSQIIKENNIIFSTYRRYQDPPFLLKAMVYAQEFYTVNTLIYGYRIEHREYKYTLDSALDLLRGIRDSFKIAWENNLVKTYEDILKNVLFNYLPVLYPFATSDQKEIWRLIGEINSINWEWRGEISEIFCNKSSLEKYVKEIRIKRNELLERFRAAEGIVIYGAGRVGKYFLKEYGKECANIVGFAVSKKDVENDSIDGYLIDEISKYDRELLIVVAVGKEYADEVLQNLKSLQFENVCYVEFGVLKVLDKL